MGSHTVDARVREGHGRGSLLDLSSGRDQSVVARSGSTIVAKLSSARIMTAASFVTSVR